MISALFILILATTVVSPPDPIVLVTNVWVGRSDLVESVVYADVASVETDKAPPRTTYVTLNVQCTLTGPYDAAAHPVLRAVISLQSRQDFFPNRAEPPRAKSHIVARLRSHIDLPSPWRVVYAEDFRPGGPSFVEVKGFDDPKVAEIIARLAKVRAAKPFGDWDAARESIIAEWANTKPAWEKRADGTVSGYSPPPVVWDFLQARRSDGGGTGKDSGNAGKLLRPEGPPSEPPSGKLVLPQG